MSEFDLKENLEISEEFESVFNLLENTRKNVFITGKAGTGKSTFLQYFREKTTKKIAVLAPTGVAAINVKGQTIHSFFNFKPDITPDTVDTIRIYGAKRKMYKTLDAIVIDEISMVRSDLLDCVDRFLRIHGEDEYVPFSGIQMIFLGDLFQLPPVTTTQDKGIFEKHYKSPYFFDAKVFKEFKMEIVELKKIYRQNDDRFIEILNMIRNRAVTDDSMQTLNQRFLPNFRPSPEECYVWLTTTNAMADQINQEQLQLLHGRPFRYEGRVGGQFENRNLPTQQNLEIKVGAQVMLLNNDSKGRWVNGTVGKIKSIEEGTEVSVKQSLDGGTTADAIQVQLSTGELVSITPYSWEMYRFFYNEEEETLDSEIVGTFVQYPLRLAWAVTIHKSQGQTFPKVVIDFGRGTFSHGQAYVALSRCTELEGIVLRTPLMRHHILLDERIVEFMGKYSS